VATERRRGNKGQGRRSPAFAPCANLMLLLLLFAALLFISKRDSKEELE
jgi:hypothetical protein